MFLLRTTKRVAKPIVSQHPTKTIVAYNAQQTGNNVFSEYSFQRALLFRHNDISSKKLDDHFKSTKMIDIVCGIWFNKSKSIVPKSSYKNSISKLYEFKSVSFNNIQLIINKWIADNTHHMITTIPLKISAKTDMIIVNAIYFNGKWKDPFNSKHTKLDQFYANQFKKPKLLQFMSKTTICKYYMDDKFTIIGKSYMNQHTMYIFLGNQVETPNFNTKFFMQYYSKLTHETVFVKIPVFTTETTHELVPKLNFTSGDPYTMQMIQTNKILVDEGNEDNTTTFSTNMSVSESIDQSNIKNFVANRPFSYFLVHDDSKSIILNGVFYG